MNRNEGVSSEHCLLTVNKIVTLLAVEAHVHGVAIDENGGALGLETEIGEGTTLVTRLSHERRGVREPLS